MSDQVEKFDPSKLMQGVKDRIKATFVSLIPDEQWEGMVQKEIDAFFNTPQKSTYSRVEKRVNWNSESHLQKEVMKTQFQELVWELCFDKTQEILKKKLNEEWFGRNWPITDENINENLKKVVVETAPLAMLRFFESISLNHMNDLRSAIQNHRI